MKKTIAALGVLGVLAFAVPVFAQYAPTYPYPAPVPSYSCPTLSYNLYRGLSDYRTQGQVTQLQQFLAGQGYYQPVTGYFGSLTYANVVRFQQQYAIYPVTGGVGPLTRAAIARVCGGTVYPPPTYGTVSITNISGPNSLTVNQQGNWSITTNAPYGSYLSTSVRWGDENLYGYPYGMAAASNVSQQTSFTHTYSQAGTYTITFTVTDSNGRTATANTTVVVGGVQNNSVSFSASPTFGTAPLAVAFSVNAVTGYDISGFSIDFGDGQTGNPQTIYCFATPCNPAMTASHTYSSAGTYTAKLMYQPPYYCPPGNYCAQMMPAPQVIETATVTVSGATGQYNVSAYPTSGFTPLTVTFSVNNYGGQYAVDFGDGTSASQVTGSVSHTYSTHGTYTATFQSDPACRHTEPSCAIATIYLGSVTITALTATL